MSQHNNGSLKKRDKPQDFDAHAYVFSVLINGYGETCISDGLLDRLREVHGPDGRPDIDPTFTRYPKS